MNFFDDRARLLKQIHQLNMELADKNTTISELKRDIREQQKFRDIRQAILTAFGEMVANGATELSFENDFNGGKIHIKREAIK